MSVSLKVHRRKAISMKNSVRLALWALACLIFGCVSVNAQNISTVIGGGPGTTGLSATGSSIGSPAAVRFDSNGNMFVLDNTFGRVLKVTPAGVVSIYAGNGTAGYSGDNGLPGSAVNAQMNGPSGMCIDSANNLYIADSDNAVIREVLAADQTIHTVVGVFTNTNPTYGGDNGPALSANLHFPDGCSFDSKGDLFIADRANNEIRVVLSAAGAAAPPVGVIGPFVAGNIYRFAGGNDGTPGHQPAGGYGADNTPAINAPIYGPFDVFVDPANNVYFTDLGNNFTEDGTPNQQAGNNTMNNNVVRVVNAITGLIQTVAGKVGVYGHDGNGAATNTALYEPKGLSMDTSGNLYFCDAVNQVIRKLVGGNLTIVAGTLNSGGFNGDTHAATSANLSFPAGSFIDGANNLYIADVVNNALRVVPLSTTFTNFGKTIPVADINTVAGNGHLSYGGDNAPVAQAELNSPAGLAVDASSNIYIVDSGSSLLRQALASTSKMSPVPLAGQTEATGFTNDLIAAPGDFGFLNGAINIATDASGNVYIADTASCIIRKRTGTGITTFAGIDPTVNNVNNPVTQNITPHCGFTSQGTPAVGTALGNVQGIAVDSKGNVFFSDSTNAVVWEVPTTTAGTLVAGNMYVVAGTATMPGFGGEGNPATAAKLKNPMGIYVDIYDNLFIADAGNHRIREVPAGNVGTMTAGSIYTIAGSGTAGVSGDNGSALTATLQYPYSIVVDNNDNVFFTDTTFNLFPTGPTTTGPFSSQTIREVVGKATGKTAGFIYRVAGSAAGVAGFNGDAAASATTAGLLNYPTGLALTPNGPSGPNATANLLVSDSINNRVRWVVGVANIQPVAIVSFSPNPGVLPAQAIGTTSAATAITLTNSGGATLNVSGVTITGTNAAEFAKTNNCTAVAAGQTCTINVTFTPTAGATGTRSATISVADDAFGTPHSVNISGTAGTPMATLNPTSLTFTSTTVGQSSAAQTVTLTNGGNVVTIVPAGGITFTGANAGDFSETDTCVGVVGIAPAATCTISVTFKPTATGSRTATLSVASNVGTASTVTLTGTGGAATLSLTVKDTDASSTQTVAAGATATYNLSVSGNQSVTAAITCTGAPTAATCSATPASVAVTAAAAGTFKVTITTTARSQMVPFNHPP